MFVFSLNLKAVKALHANRSSLDFGDLHPLASTILEVRSLEPLRPGQQPQVIFDPYGGISIYLHGTWTWVAEYDVKSGADFLDMIRSHHVSIFVINDYVASYFKLPKEDIEKALRDSGFEARTCDHQDCTIHIATK